MMARQIKDAQKNAPKSQRNQEEKMGSRSSSESSENSIIRKMNLG
jgi:hypothetical protein